MSQKTYMLWAAEVVLLGAIAVFGTGFNEEIHDWATAPSAAERQAARDRIERRREEQVIEAQKRQAKQIAIQQEREQERQAIEARKNELTEFAQAFCRFIDKQEGLSASLTESDTDRARRLLFKHHQFYGGETYIEPSMTVEAVVTGDTSYRSGFQKRSMFYLTDYTVCNISIAFDEENGIVVTSQIESKFPWQPNKPWLSDDIVDSLNNCEHKLDIEYVERLLISPLDELKSYGSASYEYSATFDRKITAEDVERFIAEIKKRQIELDQIIEDS